MSSRTSLPKLVRDTELPTTIQGNTTTHSPQGRAQEQWIRRNRNLLGRGGYGEVWLEHKVKKRSKNVEECRAVKNIATRVSDNSGKRGKIINVVREVEALAKFSSSEYVIQVQ